MFSNSTWDTLVYDYLVKKNKLVFNVTGVPLITKDQLMHMEPVPLFTYDSLVSYTCPYCSTWLSASLEWGPHSGAKDQLLLVELITAYEKRRLELSTASFIVRQIRTPLKGIITKSKSGDIRSSINEFLNVIEYDYPSDVITKEMERKILDEILTELHPDNSFKEEFKSFCESFTTIYERYEAKLETFINQEYLLELSPPELKNAVYEYVYTNDVTPSSSVLDVDIIFERINNLR